MEPLYFLSDDGRHYGFVAIVLFEAKLRNSCGIIPGKNVYKRTWRGYCFLKWLPEFVEEVMDDWLIGVRYKPNLCRLAVLCCNEDGATLQCGTICVGTLRSLCSKWWIGGLDGKRCCKFLFWISVLWLGYYRFLVCSVLLYKWYLIALILTEWDGYLFLFFRSRGCMGSCLLCFVRKE